MELKVKMEWKKLDNRYYKIENGYIIKSTKNKKRNSKEFEYNICGKFKINEFNEIENKWLGH